MTFSNVHFFLENNITQEVQSDEDEIQVTDPLSRNKNEVEEICTENHQNIVQWQVDLQYKKEQERLKIPLDPEDWLVFLSKKNPKGYIYHI